MKATVKDSDGTGSTFLHGLYLSILKAQIDHSTAEFRQMIGVLLAAAPHRPLCEGTIAKLAGVRLDLVEMWVASLSSLLYRDERANGGIRVRHLSILEFFLSNACHSNYRVNFQGANVELGISCLETMIEQLCFNICKLKDSRITNADIHDLPLRIKENISDTLQYSCLYWSNHLCFYANDGNQRVQESLRKFFEGPYGLFWIEALSVMGMVPIGVPSLRKVISTMAKVSNTSITSVFKGESNLMQGLDLTLTERIEGVRRFINYFRIAISVSTPHTYISTAPFLPSESYLSAIVFSTWFRKVIKVQRGRLLSWSSPPLEWFGHNGSVNCVTYSPDGCYIVSGSSDNQILIWDAETGSAVGKPLEGHTSHVVSIAALLMGAASSPDPATAQFECGTPRPDLQLASLSRGTLAGCCPSLTLMMAAALSPEQATNQFECGMLRLDLQLESFWRGTLAMCYLSLTLLMTAASAPDPATIQFECGMPGLDLQLVSLWRGTLIGCCPSLTLLMDATLSLDPRTQRFECGMPRLDLQLESLSRGTLAGCCPSLTLLMGATLSPDLTTQ